jgi:hypothetical protein
VLTFPILSSSANSSWKKATILVRICIGKDKRKCFNKECKPHRTYCLCLNACPCVCHECRLHHRR